MKRKLKKDKEAREAQLLHKLPTISSFFKSNANMPDDANNVLSAASSEDGTSTSNRDSSDFEPACEQQQNSRATPPPHPQPPPPPPPTPAQSLLNQEDDEHSKVKKGDDPLFWETNSDPALWEDFKSDSVRSILINRGAAAFHNRSSKYTSSLRDSGLGGKTRSLTNDLLHTRLPNGQIVSREWLLYSPSTGQVFCFSCKLFSSKRHAFTDGFSDWKHPERISEHERSPGHMSCMLALFHRSKNTQAMDSALVKQIAGKKEYGKQVLKRVVAVIKFLAERGLAFRGEDELLGSPHNGNYLGILELISQFDPFLSEHIKTRGQKGRGSVSYLSSSICEEFIDVMGEKTKQVIANELKDAKYISVIVDSTPDLSHTDQLTFIFRFVNEKGNVMERFIGFQPISGHTGESLCDCVIKMVNDLGLDILNCRGQSYDNASNMSGRYNGLQAHLKLRNPLIHYIPCAAHSLNLVGVNSLHSSPEVIQYFSLLQSLYSFCSASTRRWGTVFAKTNLTLKHLSDTRWSSRADSAKSLWKNYGSIREALNSIAEDESEKKETRNEASGLRAMMDKLETAFMAQFWNTILERFHATSVCLQKSDMDLLTAVRLLESLREFVSAQRELFEHFERSALSVPGVCQSYKHEVNRIKKRKTFAD